MTEVLLFSLSNVMPTNTPGLYVHPMPFLPGRWGITHKPSGKSIANFTSTEQAVVAANALGKRFGSFNYTEDKIKSWPQDKRYKIRLFVVEHGGEIGGRTLEPTSVRQDRIDKLKAGVDVKSPKVMCPNCGVIFRRS